LRNLEAFMITYYTDYGAALFFDCLDFTWHVDGPEGELPCSSADAACIIKYDGVCGIEIYRAFGANKDDTN